MSLSLLNLVAAVPFQYPDSDHSIAARRLRSRNLRNHMEQVDVQEQVDQHLLMTTVVDEAVDAFQSVLEPRLTRPAVSPLKLRPLTQPPNSPDNVRNTTTFDFPEEILNTDDGLEEILTSADHEGSSSESVSSAFVDLSTRNRRGRRSQRKRRRVPSFKIGQNPRVASKAVHLSSEEADDEASSDDDIIKANNSASAAASAAHNSPDAKDDCIVTNSELQLKLQVLSEAQKTVMHAEENLRQTDWAKVGAELRQIADKFSDTTSADESDGGDGSAHGFNLVDRNGDIDFVSMVNLMLPFSVPQSLWSALVSYAAWKIFKRFQ